MDATERAWFAHTTGRNIGSRDDCHSAETRGILALTRLSHSTYSLRTVYVQSTLQSTLKHSVNSTVYIKIERDGLNSNLYLLFNVDC